MAISYVLTAQVEDTSSQVNVTIIRKGRLAGCANKWKLWLNGEELCKIRNSSYCEVTTNTDSLNLVGKAVGVGTVVAFQWALQTSKVFSFTDLNRKEYFFSAKLAVEDGLQFVEFTMIEEEEARKLMERANRRSD